MGLQEGVGKHGRHKEIISLQAGSEGKLSLLSLLSEDA